MNQWFSVLGLIFSILVSAENSTSFLSNALENKLSNLNRNHSTTKMKTVFLNKKFNSFGSNIYNFNKTIEFKTLNNSRKNNVSQANRSTKGTQLLHFYRKTRYPRHVQKMYIDNDKQEASERRIKIILNLQPENEKDMYDTYEDGKYYDDYQEKNIKGLMDDWNLKSEIEKNSKPVTRTLNESQERKRCSKKIIPDLGIKQSQKPQKLLTENNPSERKAVLECKDCNVLKSNTNLEKTDNSNSESKQINDDDFINILKQLIDKLEKPKHLKSLNNEEFKIQKSNEPDPMENKAAEKKVTNNSSEEELILKIEKIKGNRILDKLDSSLENTFVNGKWIKNKLAKSKSNDCKSEVNDLKKELNDKNESISTNDTKLFNLGDPDNKVLETTSESLNTPQKISKQENKDISTSPIPEKNEHFLVSRETVKPFQFSSTLKDNLYSTKTDENYSSQHTTNEFKERFTEKDNFSNIEENKTNLGKSLEPITNSFQTTPVYESTEESTSDSNNTSTSKIKSSDEIIVNNIHRNDDHPEINNSEGTGNVEGSSSVEKENASLEDDVDCSCDKKVIKNILSSTTMQNITEIKTDLYTPPNSSKSRSSKRLNKYRRKNTQNKNSKNIINDAIAIRNENILPKYSSNKNQIKQVKPSTNNPEKSRVNLLKNSMLTDDNQPRNTKNNKENKIMKTFLKNPSPKYTILNLKPKQFKSARQKDNEEENIKQLDRIKNKPMLIIPQNPLQKNSGRSATKLKQQIIETDDNHYGKNYGNYNNNVDRITTNKRIFTTPKTLAQILTKTINQSPSHRKKPDELREYLENGENIDKKNRIKIHKKSNLGVPIEHELHSLRNFGERINADGVTETKKSTSTSKKLLQIPVEINSRPSYPFMLRQPEKFADLSDGYDTKESPRKLITRTHKYGSFYPNTRISKASQENINNEQIQNDRKYIEDNNNNINLVQLQKLPISSEYKTSTDVNNNNNIATINSYSKSNKSKPTQSTEISKTSTVSSTPIIFNDEMSSTPKLKKSLTNERTKVSSAPLFSSSPSLKNKNSLKNQFLTELSSTQKIYPKQNLKVEDYPDSNDSYESHVQKVPQLDDEHAPYTIEYLEPIKFNESTDMPETSNTNFKSISRNSLRSQSSPRNRLNNKHDLKSLNPLSAIHPEYQNYHDTFKHNNNEVKIEKQNSEPEFSLPGPSNGKNSNSDENYGKISKNMSTNQREFEVLSEVQVNNGALGQKHVDNNGSVYVSDILIPYEKSSGKHKPIPLTKLLTGDFNLRNEHDEHHLDLKPVTVTDLTLSSPRIPNGDKGSEVIYTPLNQHILKNLQAGKNDEDLTTPIQLIQIFNNSDPCSNKHKVLKSERNSECNKGINYHKFRNGSQRVSSARLQNTPNLKQLKKIYEKAYDHFDSEILDRFLQVYNPHTVQ